MLLDSDGRAGTSSFPDSKAPLTALGAPELIVIQQAYDALRTALAASRTLNGREIRVTFGDTAA
jgi:hypothetical protein